MILTSEQIAERALLRYGRDIHLWAQQRGGYEVGWKECTEHYRELIEDAIDNIERAMEQINEAIEQ